MNNNKVPTCKHKGEEPDCLELRGRGRSWTEIEKLRRERNMTKLERTARAAVIPTVIATVIAAVVAAVVIATEVSSKKRIEKEASDFSRLSASELVFPKDVKFLTDEAARFNLEFEAIDDEEKFKSLQEKVRKNLIVETLEPYKIAGFLRKLDRVEWTEEALGKLRKELEEIGIFVEFDFKTRPGQLGIKTEQFRIATALMKAKQEDKEKKMNEILYSLADEFHVEGKDARITVQKNGEIIITHF